MKTVEERRRELFEQKYTPDDGVEWNPHNSKYETFSFFDRSRQHHCDWQNDMLEVFNAALDFVEIELPALKNSSSYYDGGDVYDSAINQCRYKIEALNLGIKIK